MGAPSASAASSSGQYFSSSRYSLPVCELMITPFSLSSVTARSISAAAAFGSCGATAARPANRPGCLPISSASRSLASRASAVPSAGGNVCTPAR